MRGFTLLETLLVLSILSALVFLTAPIGLTFYQTQALDEATLSTIETLRRAKFNAIFQRNDSAFGVKFMSDSYTLFQGDSYTSREENEDELFLLPADITTSGISEIVFSKMTGVPNSTGTITLTLGTRDESIIVDDPGVIDRQ